MTESVTLPAPAKANLWLRVLSRESDGYHGIETLFCRLELADTLTAIRRPGGEVGISLETDGAELGPAEQNLAYRAAEAALQLLRAPFGIQLSLSKRIPVGAGLGGGSADAAAALTAVNQLAGGVIPHAELLHAAARLGADVPFCLSGAPLALGWGRGDRLLTLPGLPAAPVLLVTPALNLSTAEAYGWLDQARTGTARRGALALDPASLGRWSDVARMAGNDFESVVFARHPPLRAAFEALARTGPLLCRMSGSGASLLAVYRTERDRDEARLQLGKQHGVLIATRTT